MSKREARGTAMNCGRVRDLAAGFVLGALEPAEMAAVRDHLDTCREPHPELAELGGVVPYLAMLVEPVEPRDSLRSSILAAVEVEARGRRRNDEAAERLITTFARPKPIEAADTGDAAAAAETLRPAPVNVAAPEAAPAAVAPEPIPIRRGPSRLRHAMRFVVAAAAAIALVVGGVAMDRMVLQPAAPTPDSAGPAIGSKQAVLVSPSGGTDQTGVALLHANGHLIVTVYGLKPTKGPQVYEVWLVPAGRAPIPLGSFRVDESGSGGAELETNGVPGAADVAVSFEASGYVAIPSTPMLLRGPLQPQPIVTAAPSH